MEETATLRLDQKSQTSSNSEPPQHQSWVVQREGIVEILVLVLAET